MKNYASILTDDYQLTIPIPVRKALNLNKGDIIFFHINSNGHVLLSGEEKGPDNPILESFHEIYGTQLNERQNKVIARIFQEKGIGLEDSFTVKTYCSIATCSLATASRDLNQLCDLGALTAYGEGSNRRYEISLVESIGNIISRARLNANCDEDEAIQIAHEEISAHRKRIK